MVLEFLRNAFGLTSSFVKVPVVKAEDDDDEDDGTPVDPMIGLRAVCEKEKEAIALYAKLEECNKRVRSKKKTAETCEEELHDWVHFVDHCASKTLFTYLK